jgi:predicted glycosyltransferase
MLKKGHKIYFTVRSKEFEIDLLNHENLPFINLGIHYKSKSGKIWGLFKYNWKILKISLDIKPDLYLSHGSIYTLLSSFLLKKPNIALEDSGNKEQVRLYLPFTSAVLTSTCFIYSYGKKQILYNGYHELAYLHPKFFTPDYSVKSELGLEENEKIFIVRFVSWNASHDFSHSGLNLRQKQEIVRSLLKYGKVFISSEDSLPSSLEEHRFPLSPARMHHALALAHLFIGEGATMASECAMIGTPAIYVNTQEAGTINEQEKYGLIFHFRKPDGVIEKAIEIIENEKIKAIQISKRDLMLKEKIDLTAFLIWLIEHYPNSLDLIRANPSIVDNFK